MSTQSPDARALALLMDIKLPVQIALGRTRVPLADLLRLGPGSVLELDGEAESEVEIIVHDRVIARGEVVDVDGDYGVRIISLNGKPNPASGWNPLEPESEGSPA